MSQTLQKDPIQIFYPNGGTSAVQLYVWDTMNSQPIIWDGKVSFSGSISIGSVTGEQTHNSAAPPAAEQLGVLPAVASASAPSYGAGNQVLLSTDLSGNLRTVTAIAANSSVNVAQVGGNSTAVGSGTVSTGTQRVTLATDVALPAGTNTLGNVNVLNNKTIKTVTGTFTSTTDIISAVTSKRLKVLGYALFTFGTSATTITFKSNGSGGTALWTILLQAVSGAAFGANMTASLPGFIFATAAGEKLTAVTNTGDTIAYSVSYYDDDAT